MAGQRARGARRSGRAHGQHFLRSLRLAEAIVRDAGVGPGELVLDLGAGSGRLTEPLARTGADVVAIELDSALAARLRERLRRFENVAVVEDDALHAPLPDRPFRVLANPPFGQTTAILRRLLDDPALPLERADLVLEWSVAWKRTSCWPSTLLNVCWGVRFELALVRRLPAACFEPRPSVDAGLVRIVRRPEPLVSAGELARFEQLVRAGFAGDGRLRRTLAGQISAPALKRAGRELGFGPQASARDLDVRQWTALHGAVRPGS